MKTSRILPKTVIRPTLALALAAAVGCGFVSTLAATEPKADAATPPPAAKKLTGSELYAVNCNRCHQKRYPTEFNSGQWQTLMTHMRVRANLPAKQAKEVLKYMKEEAGK